MVRGLRAEMVAGSVAVAGQIAGPGPTSYQLGPTSAPYLPHMYDRPVAQPVLPRALPAPLSAQRRSLPRATALESEEKKKDTRDTRTQETAIKR